ncbi:hypothetical protein [Enterococcus ureasiticus]|uniref:WxL domain-containing protein n=1 Tax=Enterococcus ureasiticus TaxID=903984 RepID=A0A1E5G9X5_9ENTE|nr:hypothetical protein [Enterococcus ureasiticus]OEG09516.1 hypothetical protein BCR21_14285 [Enterococcus ureasiticus]
MKKRILSNILFSFLFIPFISCSKVDATIVDSSFPEPKMTTQSPNNRSISDKQDSRPNTIETQETITKDSSQQIDSLNSANNDIDNGILHSDITKKAIEKLQGLKNQLEQSKGIGIYIGDELTIPIDGNIHLSYTLSDQSVVTYDGMLSFEKPNYQNFPSTKTEFIEQSLKITREREALDKKFYETVSARWRFIGTKSFNGEKRSNITIDQVDNTWEYPLSTSLVLNVDVPPLLVDAPRGTSKDNPILIEKGTPVSDDPNDYFRVISSGYEPTIEWHVRPDFTKEIAFTAELGIRDKFDQYWTVNGQSSVTIYFKVVDDPPEYLTSLTTEISYIDIQFENGIQGIRVDNKLDADVNTILHSIPAQLNYMRFSFPGEFSLLAESISLEAIAKDTHQKIPIGKDEYSLATAGNTFSLTNLSKRIEMFYAQEELIIHYDLKKHTRLTREAYCVFETNYSPQNNENDTVKTLTKIQEPESTLTLTVPETLDFGKIEIGKNTPATLASVSPESLSITDNRKQKSNIKLLVDLSVPLEELDGNKELIGGLYLDERASNPLGEYVFYEGIIKENEGDTFDLTDQLIKNLRLTIPEAGQTGMYEGTIKWTLISAEP